MKNDIKKQLWISGAIIFGSMVVAAAVVYYLSFDIAAKAKAIADDRSLTDQKTGVLAVLAGLKAQAPQAAAYQAAIDQLIPSQDGLIGFGGWLNQIASSDGVTANFSFDGDPVPASGNIPGYVAFSLNASGPINNIVNFLDDIESKSPGFLLSIKSFDLTEQTANYQIVAQGQLFSR